MAATCEAQLSQRPQSSGAAGIRQTHRHACTQVSRQGLLTSISVGNQVENGDEVYFGTGMIFLSPLSSALLSELAP